MSDLLSRKCESKIAYCELCGYESIVHLPKQGDTAPFNLKPSAVDDKLREIVEIMTNEYLSRREGSK
jgi:hypothetical protein